MLSPFDDENVEFSPWLAYDPETRGPFFPSAPGDTDENVGADEALTLEFQEVNDPSL